MRDFAALLQKRTCKEGCILNLLSFTLPGREISVSREKSAGQYFILVNLCNESFERFGTGMSAERFVHSVFTCVLRISLLKDDVKSILLFYMLNMHLSS